MKSARNVALVVLALGAATTLAGIGEAPPPDRHFLDRVKPLLDSRCVSCHGPEKQKGALRLDSREALVKGGDSGPAAVPGKPEESLLLLAVLHARPELEMPPKDKLSPAETEAFRRWILDGIPWPAPPPTASNAAEPTSPPETLGDAWSDPRNPIRRIFLGQRLDLWSLRPVADVAPPPVAEGDPGESRHPIDRFLRARFRQDGIPPAPEADRRTLARRLHFDLTGLPPDHEAVERFRNDARPDAYERLVDTLLASPRYGEHFARQWLDVVRYSDSNGFDWDEFRPQAWRFRDYVVRSFNADKPFDRFVLEQIAGDELLAGPPRNAEEQDALIATGYLRLGPQDNSAPLFDEQARARAEWLADLTETTGSAFLGMTLSCCRCHDHKFDPVSQADHFRIRAFFQPIQYGDPLPLDLADEQDAIRAQHRATQERIDPLARRRTDLVQSVKNRLRAERMATLSDFERSLIGVPGESLPADQKALASEVAKKLALTDDETIQAAREDESRTYRELTRDIETLEKSKRPFTRGLLATDTTQAVPPTRIHFQGDPKAERAAVEPGFLSVLDPNAAVMKRPASTNTTGRRLTLASWIASPSHPLTARVYVNRAWQAFFGRGLVETPNDFGLAGAKPSHPELLDWLAGEFVRGGGSTKKLHRLIVTSAAYRQVSSMSSAVDRDAPFARQNLRRLSAEQLRDALLSVAQILRETPGGPPSWPELPADVLQANPAFLDDNAEKTKGWYPSPPELRPVRSLYLVQKRTVKVPFLETFDLPENTTSCPRRTESIVAPQALSLLNGTDAVEAARALATRVAAEAPDDPTSRIVHAFRRALQRDPSPAETERSRSFLRESSLTELCRVLLNLNEFAFLD